MKTQTKGFIMKSFIKRAFKSMFGISNVPFYIDSDKKREIYPNKWAIEQGKTEISHIALTDEYPDAKILLEYFNLDPAKVVFFIRTDKAEIPYSNPIAILNDMDNGEVPFIYTRNGLFWGTYIFGTSLTPDVHGFEDEIIGQDAIFPYHSVMDKRRDLNSIFYPLPTENSLLQSMFGNGDRKLPGRLIKYLSKLEITEKNSPIFQALVYADESFRESLKAFEGKYIEAKAKATSKKKVFPNPYIEYEMMSQESWDKLEKAKKEGEITDVLDEEMLLNLIAAELPEFAKVWEIEKRREEFISSNGLEDWFLTKLKYIPYNGYQSSYFDNTSVKNTFKYLIFALDELYDGFLPAMLKGKFDFSQESYPGYHFGTSRAKQNDISRFFELTHILDQIDDDKKISFVNMSRKELVKNQIELDCNIVIVKLPNIDSENKELSNELRKKAEENFHDGLNLLGIEAKAYFF